MIEITTKVRTQSALDAVSRHVTAGRIDEAVRAADRAARDGAEIAPVRGLLGMMLARVGHSARAIDQLLLAREEAPADHGLAAALVSLLTSAGRTEEALAHCPAELALSDPTLMLTRYRGFLLQQAEDFPAAVEAYRAVVARASDDWESWNNLGTSLESTGDFSAAVDALERAIALAPDVAPTRLNFAQVLVSSGRFDEAREALEKAASDFPDDAKPLVDLSGVFTRMGRDADALAALERAVAREPTDPELHNSLAKESSAQLDFGRAEAAFSQAIALDPVHDEAHVGLALVFERMNREVEFSSLIADAESRGVAPGTIEFIRALDHRRGGRLEEGLAAIRNAPSTLAPVRHANLEGQFLDRIGDAAGAFAAFVEMNRRLAEESPDAAERARQFRAELMQDAARVTPEWFAGWRATPVPDKRQSPAFLVGFPRSGTTLLDTMLMGHPDVEVMEEKPPLSHVRRELGTLDALATMDEAQLAAARDDYFGEAAKHAPLRRGTLLVDKHPLHMNKVPLIHRLFPDAKFILALRHPCDVLLSCFMTSFRMNNAMVNFLDLDDAAALYDLSFSYWEQCRSIMPIAAHTVRYETMVEDSEAELRPLIDFLGLDWRPELLDHQRTARDRGLITTASFAQVVQPIYKRAAGRWERYREQLAPVLPVLEPWVRRYGYSL